MTCFSSSSLHSVKYNKLPVLMFYDTLFRLVPFIVLGTGSTGGQG